MKVLKLFAAIFLVAVVAAFLFNAPSFGSKGSKTEGFCANCHEMKPNYFTWLVSSHNNFSCLKCHKDLKPTTFVYKHWKGAFANPIEKRNIIPDGVCRSCHAIDRRNVSAPGDVIFPHQLHVVKQIDCVDCHSNVTHFHVSDYLKTNQDVAAASFDSSKAETLIKKGNQILMPVCMRCHNGDMATESCKACHKNAKTEDKIVVR